MFKLKNLKLICFACQEVMDKRGRRGRVACGTRYPPQPTPLHFPPRLKDHAKIPIGEVMNMMHLFPRILDALNRKWDKEEGGALIHVRGSQNQP